MDIQSAQTHFPKPRSRRSLRLDVLLLMMLILLLLAFLGFSAGAS